ncbi:unnamed protein product, partial [Amoebophrya sp. A120]
ASRSPISWTLSSYWPRSPNADRTVLVPERPFFVLVICRCTVCNVKSRRPPLLQIQQRWWSSVCYAKPARRVSSLRCIFFFRRSFIFSHLHFSTLIFGYYLPSCLNELRITSS